MAFSANYLLFLSDDTREDRYLVRYFPIDRDGNAVVVAHSTDTFGTKATDSLASTLFEAQLLTGFSFVSSVNLESFFGIVPDADGGVLEHQNNHGDLDSWRSDYYFDGRRAVVYHGGYSELTGDLAFDDYGIVYDGIVQGQPLVSLDRAVVRLRSVDGRLDYPMTTSVHCGLPWHLYGDGVPANNNFVTFGTSTAFNFTSFPFAVGFRWLPNSIPGTASTILTKGAINVNGYQVRQMTDGTISIATSQLGTSQQTVSTTVLKAGKKYSVEFVFAASGECFLYINGELDARGTTHTAPATAAGNSLFLLKNNAGTVFADGFLNEVRLWNTARGAADVSAVSQRTLSAAERLGASLVGYWPMSDGSGTTIFEQSGEGSNGTITGATWYRALEGSSDLEGERHPQAWGVTENVPGVLVEANPPIWQLHAARMAEGTIAKEGGFPRTLGTSFTTWASFLAATTAADTFDVLRSQGGTFVRLNIPPALPVTFDIPGDDSDGTNRVGSVAISRHLITNFGPNAFDDATELDVTEWDAAEAAETETHGLWWTSDLTIRDVVNRFLGSSGHSVYRSRNSLLYTIKKFTGVADLVSGKGTVETITENDLVKGSLETISARPPVWITRLKARRNYFEMKTSDLSAALNSTTYDDVKRFLFSEWRTVRGPNASVRALRLQARELLIPESTFRYHEEARAEAIRRTALYDGEEQAFTVLALPGSLRFDLFDPVYVRIRLEDEFGDDLDRIGTGDEEAFIIIAIGAQPNSGNVRLTLYREDS